MCSLKPTPGPPHGTELTAVSNKSYRETFKSPSASRMLRVTPGMETLMWSGSPEPQPGASHGTLVRVHGPGTGASGLAPPYPASAAPRQLCPAVSSCAAHPTPGQPSSCMSIGASKPSPNFRLQQTAPFGLPMALFLFLAPNAKQQGDVVSLSTRHLRYKNPSLPLCPPLRKASSSNTETQTAENFTARVLASPGSCPAPAPTPRCRWGSCPAPRPGARWAGGSSGPRAPRARCPGRTP